MAQTDPPEAGELFGLRSVSTTDMVAVANPFEGTVIYNTTEKAIFYYDGSRWINTKRTSSSGTILIEENQVNNLGNANQTVTAQIVQIMGLGFKPSRVEFVAYANIDAIGLNGDSSAAGNNDNSKENSFGYMTGYAQMTTSGVVQQVISGGGNGNSINDISRFASNSLCVGIRYGNQNGDQVGLTTATFTSFDNDGFTITSSRRDDALLIIYTAYQ